MNPRCNGLGVTVDALPVGAVVVDFPVAETVFEGGRIVHEEARQSPHDHGDGIGSECRLILQTTIKRNVLQRQLVSQFNNSRYQSVYHWRH